MQMTRTQKTATPNNDAQTLWLKDFFDVSHLGDEPDQFGWPTVRITDPATGRNFRKPDLSDGGKVQLAYKWNRARSLMVKVQDAVVGELDDLVQDLFAEEAPATKRQVWFMLHPKNTSQVIFVKLRGATPKVLDPRQDVGHELTPSEHPHNGRRTMTKGQSVEVRGGLLICQVSCLLPDTDQTAMQVAECDVQKRDMIQKMLHEKAGLAHWLPYFVS